MGLFSGKFDWGKGLTFAIILFILSMLAMVYVAFRQTNEMIEDHYYERELKYQQVIDAKNELKNVQNHSFLTPLKGAILLSLPDSLSTNIISGKLELIRMDNQSLDRIYRLSHGEKTKSISNTDLSEGPYHVKLQWVNDGKEYYYEDDYFHRK